ncbi:1499_t:CDS:2 [Funneliformis caledonium]|uniref:1499_t:CDS:1 n=1 Tax=Funneliformis caledonium TaxID=1117310 RepID=A0A9N9HYK0_9GLOM|nr:1499_t:CDS:2 [Funneliformis caledonium]
MFAVYSTEEMSSEPTESQITVVIEGFFKTTVTWSLIRFLQYRKEVDDFTYSKRQEHRLYRSALKALSDDQAETSLLNFEPSSAITQPDAFVPLVVSLCPVLCNLYLDVALSLVDPIILDEKSSEAVKNFWLLIDKERSKHEIENIQLDYTKRVLNDTNNETHQIRTVATNNAIKTLKHALEGDESNREKKKKSVSRKERAHSPALNYSLVEPPMLVDRINNPFIEKDEVDDILVIDDVDDLYFMDGDPADDYKIEEINVSQLFRKYQNNSVNISKTEGLFVESNIHEILSLSSIFLLNPDSHSRKMIDIFGSPLLDKIHQRIIPTQQTALDAECEAKFRDAIKRVTKESFSHATDWLMAELSNNKHLKDNMGFIILDCLRTLPFTKIKNDPSEMTLVTNYLDRIMRGMLHDPNRHIIEWPNTGLDESKARKSGGRAKQPDFVVSVIHQLQICGVIFVGEVSPPSEKNNVYKNCKDLIRIGVFMKDCLDVGIEKGADLKVLGFQCVEYKMDFYVMDLIHGMYMMTHIGQVYIPSSIKEMNLFVNEVETLLKVREIFCKSFDTLYSKLCNPSPPSPKTIFKRNTLGTPKFNELVNKTRNCHRDCPMWYGRFDSKR